MTDIFSKAINLFPSKRITAKTISNIIEKYFQSNDARTIMVSDGGKQFDSDAWRKLGGKYKCISRLTSPQNHQPNRIERFMKELGRVFRANCNKNHSSWEKWLKPLEVCYKSQVHKSTKMAPAKIQNKNMLRIPCALGAQIDKQDQEKVEIKQV